MGEEPYVPCPCCKGERLVWACVDPGNDFFPSRWQSFDCPICRATGQAERDRAVEWQEEHADDPDEDVLGRKAEPRH